MQKLLSTEVSKTTCKFVTPFSHNWLITKVINPIEFCLASDVHCWHADGFCRISHTLPSGSCYNGMTLTCRLP